MAKHAANIPIRVTAKRPPLAAPMPATSAEPKPQRRSTSEVPVVRRQQMMWWVVGVGTAVIAVAWVGVVRLQLQTKTSDNTIQHIIQIFRTNRSSAKSPAENEIRQLDQKVFPEFQ